MFFQNGTTQSVKQKQYDIAVAAAFEDFFKFRKRRMGAGYTEITCRRGHKVD